MTDSVNCCIKKFTPHGKLLQKFEKCGGLSDVAFCHGALFLVIENNSVRARDANLNYSFHLVPTIILGQNSSNLHVA